MASAGWERLMEGCPWFRGEGCYPIAAYSEFMPPPRAGCKPYEDDPQTGWDGADPWGWPVSEGEEELDMRPGMARLAKHLVKALSELAQGKPVHGLSHRKLADNRAWPAELAERKEAPAGERFVTLLPLALAQTLDDKGRVRWTVFGSSEQGPARAFWRSFFHRPRKQASADEGEAFIRRLLHAAHGEPLGHLADLGRAGFRIYPSPDLPYPFDREGPLPAWTKPYLWTKDDDLTGVRYLLTFCPFADLPDAVRDAYLEGRLHLLPYPGSLVFWGTTSMPLLQKELPLAQQIPLLNVLPRHEALHDLRVPQSGLMHEPHPEGKPHGHPLDLSDPRLPMHNTYRRTSRNARVARDADELGVRDGEDRLAHVLFSRRGDDMGLYGKPMARNVQIWDHDYRLLLDGPRATAEQLQAAALRVEEGGVFGYRFQFPALRVGRHEVYWHRPLVAFLDASTNEPAALPEAPLGYLTAYHEDRINLNRPVELWPRLLRRGPYLEALHLFQHPHDPHPYQTSRDVRLLFETWELRGEKPLPRSLAHRLVTTKHDEPLENWLADLAGRASDPIRGGHLIEEIDRCLEPADQPVALPEPLTFAHTARRSFEVAYWKDIASLAEGNYITKCNADCVLDAPTQERLQHHDRDLDKLGDYLLSHYERVVAAAGMKGKALVGEIPFRWQTDFAFSWMGGWLQNQEGQTYERDLIVVIPGRNRRQAVIMADHYDTAYMLDCYDPQFGGTGARLAAAGADDNHSATAALMRAAPIFLEMSKAGRLGCDVWLIHLTGEEFPADCLGARHLAQLLVEGRLKMRTTRGRERDLSKVRVRGLYVLDMVAHNSAHGRDIFQIAPGTGRQALWLAEQAHLANEVWNAATRRWNRRAGRRGAGRSQRSAKGSAVPPAAAHLALRGEVRLPRNPHSTLYNTDGQIFSDAGIPAVLFMENYDINRTGYHDTHDTMENIDLDYGAAVVAIAIESVARAATTTPPWE